MMTALSDQRIGFIGVGNMGEAILSGALAAEALDSSSVFVTDVREDLAERIAAQYSVTPCRTLSDLASESNCILYAAKPQNMEEILHTLAAQIVPTHWIVSIAAGIRTSTVENALGSSVPVVRVMPNIAASVGHSMTAVCGGVAANETHLAMTESLFAAIGITVRLSEELFDVVTGLSASGPGFAFLVIEAMADAGVREGLTFEQARLLAAQTLLGAATMALSTDDHPAALKARVTSPGGTTAAGLAALEESGVRAAFARAITLATERSRELATQ